MDSEYVRRKMDILETVHLSRRLSGLGEAVVAV